ncbi:hypothetical protein B4Q13_24600, partial [Lacticaseibacillus rhamnosus]
MTRPFAVTTAERQQLLEPRSTTSERVKGLLAVGLCATAAMTEPAAHGSPDDLLRQYFKPSPIEAGGDLMQLRSRSMVVIQQSGIISVADADSMFLDVCPSVYRDGDVHPPQGSFCTDPAHKSYRTLAPLDRAFVTGIRMNGAADKLSFFKC